MLANFGMIVTEGRGSLGGTTFSRNRGGAYARNRTIPMDPNTAYQQTQRGYVASISAVWRTLTDAQRLSWLVGCKNFPYTDIFGNTRILSGFQLYLQLNLNLTRAGVTNKTTCPFPTVMPEIHMVSLSADVSIPAVVGVPDINDVPADYQLFIYMTDNYSPGISYVKNLYRYLTLIAAEDPCNPIDVWGNWDARFGSLVADQKLSMKIALVSIVTGQLGLGSSASCIITA